MSGASVERGYVKNITQEGIRVESITRPGIVTPPMELLEVMEDPQPGDMVYYYMFSDGKCRILAVKPQQGGGGATEHGKLTGREKDDQHPIRAITGLQQKLDTIPTKVSQLQNDEHFVKEDEVPDKVSDLENDSGFITPNDVKNGLADIDRAAFGTDDADEKQMKIPEDWDYFRGEKRLVDIIYPVGSIYMSVNAADPALLFGGTWERIEGRFLLAASGTHYAGETGGSETHTPGGTVGSHTLTVNEMPSHNHTQSGHTWNWGGNQQTLYVRNSSVAAISKGTQVPDNDLSAQQGVKGYASTNDSGGGAGHNHGFTGTSQNTMPPFLSVYIWKRTA